MNAGLAPHRGRSRGHGATAEVDPKRPFVTAPTDSRVVWEADIRNCARPMTAPRARFA